MAIFEGMTVSEFIRKIILEQVEDKLDYQAGIDVLSEHNDRVSREEVLRENFFD